MTLNFGGLSPSLSLSLCTSSSIKVGVRWCCFFFYFSAKWKISFESLLSRGRNFAVNSKRRYKTKAEKVRTEDEDRRRMEKRRAKENCVCVWRKPIICIGQTLPDHFNPFFFSVQKNSPKERIFKRHTQATRRLCFCVSFVFIRESSLGFRSVSRVGASCS